MWDLNLEDDKAELRRVQNREQPELLVGSPTRDEFSSLLSKRVEPREITKLKTEKIEPQIRACVQSYKYEHPEDSSSWETLEVQSLIDDPRVYSIDGPMCRWSLRSERDGSRVPKKLLQYFMEMVDGNATRDLST